MTWHIWNCSLDNDYTQRDLSNAAEDIPNYSLKPPWELICFQVEKAAAFFWLLSFPHAHRQRLGKVSNHVRLDALSANAFSSHLLFFAHFSEAYRFVLRLPVPGGGGQWAGGRRQGLGEERDPYRAPQQRPHGVRHARSSQGITSSLPNPLFGGRENAGRWVLALTFFFFFVLNILGLSVVCQAGQSSAICCRNSSGAAFS